MDKISVLIPVYNCERYLEKCLDSVLKQTYKNIEIIIIDDGSTDNSYKICKNYQKLDCRIKLFRIENKGVANARNCAIKKSEGKYISFIDSDDIISDTYIENLYKYLIKFNADISVCDTQEIYEQNLLNSKFKNSNPKIVLYDNIEAMEALFFENKLRHSPWGKLYKKQLFENLEYPLIEVYEDLAVTYKLFYRTKKIIFIEKKMYFYNIRSGSLMHSEFNKKNMKVFEIMHNLQNQLVVYNEKRLKNADIYLMTRNSINILSKINDCNLYNSEVNECYSFIKKYRKKLIFDKRINKKFKLLLICSLLGKRATIIFCKLKNKKRGK